MNNPLKYTDPSGYQYFRNYDELPFMDSGAGYAAGSAFYRADMISNYGYSAATAMMPHWSVSTRNPGTNFAHMNRRTFEGIYGKGAYDYQIAENAAENASNGNVSNDNELFRIYAYDANDNLIGIDIYYLTNKKNGFNGRMDDLMKDDGATGRPELAYNGISSQEAAYGITALGLSISGKTELFRALEGSKNLPKYFKGASKFSMRLGFVGLGVTTLDGFTSTGGWQNHHTADLLLQSSMLAVATFFPGVGWLVAGGYFIGDLVFQHYHDGKSITEHYFDKP